MSPAEGEPSGRILLRLPSSLHAHLVSEAKREGVSLNQFAAAALAASVGWRLDPPPPASPAVRKVAATGAP